MTPQGRSRIVRSILCAGLAGGLLSPASSAEGRCTVTREGTDVVLGHVYAIRLADPFTDGAMRVRVLCVGAPFDAEELASDEASRRRNGRLRGTITTSEPLTFDDAQPGWTFTAEVDAEIIDAR